MAKPNGTTAAFLVLAAPFYVNDFALIALDGTYSVYLVDYLTRTVVLATCFLWPLSRDIAWERHAPEWGTVPAVLCVALLPVSSRVAYHVLEAPFVRLTGIDGLFAFEPLVDPTLYWLDLTAGLFAVALSEELVFRKFAMRWLAESGHTPARIVVISALLFSLMHWGSGPGRLLYTFAVGLLFMAVYLRLKRLWPLVLAHWIENFIAFGGAD